MPFGLRMQLTVLVHIALGGGKRKFGYLDMACSVLHFGVFAKVAEQQYLETDENSRLALMRCRFE